MADHSEQRQEIKCRVCQFKVFDGLVIRSAVVRVMPVGCEAKCKQCKNWVKLPLVYKIVESA